MKNNTYPPLSPENIKTITDFFSQKAKEGWFLYKKGFSSAIVPLAIKRKYEKLYAKDLSRNGINSGLSPAYPSKTKLKIKVLEDVYAVMNNGTPKEWRVACLTYQESQLRQLPFTRLTQEDLKKIGTSGIRDDYTEYTVCALVPKEPKIDIYHYIPKNHVITNKELEAAFQIALHYGIILNKELLLRLKRNIEKYGPIAAGWFGHSNGYIFDF